MVVIKVSSKFEKQYRRLPQRIKAQAKEKELIFRNNLFEPVLKTHKLSGKDENCWAFWINYSYRIKFLFLAKNKILFLEIGKHDIYK